MKKVSVLHGIVPSHNERLTVTPDFLISELKGMCQNFEKFVIVLWIRNLIHVDLICERNFEIGFIVFKYSPLIFLPKYFLENDSEKNKTLAIV